MNIFLAVLNIGDFLLASGWNTTFLLGFGLFSGAFVVSFREGIIPFPFGLSKEKRLFFSKRDGGLGVDPVTKNLWLFLELIVKSNHEKPMPLRIHGTGIFPYMKTIKINQK